MRVIKRQKAYRILVLNAKGGCGKTTVATNLACQYAAENEQTVIVDYDPQASTTHWLEARPKDAATINCITAFLNANHVTRSFQLNVPLGTTRVIVDTPARLETVAAAKLIREADTILIPVLASPIDIRAATQFIDALLKDHDVRRANKRIAVLGNRVRRNTKAYAKLREYLQNLDIPFITSLRDTQNYVRAAEEGLGVQELKLKSARQDSMHWQSLVRWIEQRDQPDPAPVLTSTAV